MFCVKISSEKWIEVLLNTDFGQAIDRMFLNESSLSELIIVAVSIAFLSSFGLHWVENIYVFMSGRRAGHHLKWSFRPATDSQRGHSAIRTVYLPKNCWHGQIIKKSITELKAWFLKAKYKSKITTALARYQDSSIIYHPVYIIFSLKSSKPNTVII